MVFIEGWLDRWHALSDLLIEILQPDRPCSKPSQSDELRYENLRSWFIANEPQFFSLWNRYYRSHDWTLDINEDLVQQIHYADKCLENPFRHFYMVESLDSLLHCISGSSERYPTEKEAWDTAVALYNVDCMAISCFAYYQSVSL